LNGLAWLGDHFVVPLDGLGLGFRQVGAFDSEHGISGIELTVRGADWPGLRHIDKVIQSADVQLFFTPSLTRSVDYYAAGGFRIFQARQPRGLLHVNGMTVDSIAEGGLWFRWISRFELRAGIGTSLNDKLRFTVNVSKAIAGGLID
jgi:hypothetical protein